MTACAGREERDNAGWCDMAVSHIEKISEQRIMRGSFTAEELRAEIRIDPPKDLRAWGAVTVSALKAKLIEPTGEYRAAMSSHGSPKPCYRFVPKGYRK